MRHSDLRRARYLTDVHTCKLHVNEYEIITFVTFDTFSSLFHARSSSTTQCEPSPDIFIAINLNRWFMVSRLSLAHSRNITICIRPARQDLKRLISWAYHDRVNDRGGKVKDAGKSNVFWIAEHRTATHVYFPIFTLPNAHGCCRSQNISMSRENNRIYRILYGVCCVFFLKMKLMRRTEGSCWDFFNI